MQIIRKNSKKISKELNINKDQIIGMGDVANDMNMLLSVGLPIAFKAQDIVKANFENQINNTDLTFLLYFMGIKKLEAFFFHEG